MVTASFAADLRRAEAECVREPIGRPGAIQPAGMLHILDAATGRALGRSANACALAPADLKRASVGNVAFEFRQQLGDVQSTLPGGGSNETVAATGANAALVDGAASADIVDGAWNKLEHALQDVSKRRVLGEGRGRFKKAELHPRTVGLSAETIDQIPKLRELRNSVLRQPEALRAAGAIRFAGRIRGDGEATRRLTFGQRPRAPARRASQVPAPSSRSSRLRRR